MKHSQAQQSKKIVICIVLLSVILININLISADDWFSYDNYASFDESVGEYGKITIFDKNIFSEDNPLQEILLIENTEICSNNNCKATKEIIMHEPGALISDVRFLNLRTGKQIKIKDYNFYVINGEKKTSYQLGTEVEAGTYEVDFEGELKPFQSVDWQIKINEYWIDEWAEWTSALNVDLIAYYAMEEGVGVEINNSLDSSKFHGDLINTPSWTTGIIGTGVDLEFASNQLINITSPFPLGNNWTISLWIKAETLDQATHRFWSMKADDLIYAQEQDNINMNIGGISVVIVESEYEGFWKHLVFRQNGTHVSLWINGTLVDSGASSTNFTGGSSFVLGASVAGVLYFDGVFDEVGIWNRALSPTEINQTLFNDGSPPAFGISKTQVTLLTPTNNIRTADVPLNFSASITPIINGNITNVTILIYDLDGILLNQTSKSLTGNVANITNFSIFNLEAQTITWNVFACSGNTTKVSCDLATSNLTVNYGITENSQTFNSKTTEGNNEDFLANITLILGESVSQAILHYANQTFVGETFLISGDTIIRRQNVVAPDIGPQTNITFNWRLTLASAKTINLTSQTQQIFNISIDNCTSFTNVLFNFTLVDEEFQNKLIGNTTIEVALDLLNLNRNIQVLNFSGNFNNTNSLAICLSTDLLNNSKYSTDLIVRYEAGNHENEYYNIINFILTNNTQTQNITLFDLATSDSTEFQLTFTGSDFLAVENALVFVKRRYIAENVFKVVELPKTDSNGQTVLHLVRNDVIYNIEVQNGTSGEVLGSFNNIIAFCEDFTIGDCKINLDASTSGEEVFKYNNALGITFTGPTFDNSTRIMTFNYLTIDSSIKTIRMEVLREDIFGNRSLCNSTLISSGGTLVCTVPSIDDTTIITKIFVSGIEVIKTYTKIDSLNFGKAGYLIFFVFLLAFIFMFGKSKTMMLIGILLGFITGISLSLIEGRMVGLGATGIWLIIVVILMIWKLNKDKPN